MLFNKWLRQIAPSFSLIATLLLVWSCSEGPAPSPISPSANANKSNSSPQAGAAVSTLRPVKRLAKSTQSLAKAGYNVDKVERELQAVVDELEGIVSKGPGRFVEDRLDDAAKEASDARLKILRMPTDDKGALDKIRRATDRVQDAMYRGYLLWPQGMQFIEQLDAIDKQIRYGVYQDRDHRGERKELWVRRSYGGMIKFAGHSIDVPKYATKQDAEFSITISRNDYITVDFGPDGWFDQQVTVTISYENADLSGIDPNKLTLAWFDERTQQWVDHGGVVDLVKKTVTAKAWHFTQYTLSAK